MLKITSHMFFLWVLLTVGGCHDQRQDHSEFLVISKEQQAAWVQNFNPLFSASARWPTRGAIYEPLMVYNKIGKKFVPWLATDFLWSKDKLSLEVNLRKEVRWSDGESFSADDVLFTFKLLKKHKVLDQGNIWDYIDKIDSSNDHQVKFHFKRVFIPGFDRLVHQPIVPKHIWKKISDPVEFANKKPVGTGPYTEVIRFQNQVFELGRNPNYWQNDGFKIKGLRFPAFPSNQQANLALINGDIDWAGNFVPAIERTFVSRNPEHHHYWYPDSGAMIFLYLNTKLKPYDNAKVRQAISQAINRERLVKVALYNYSSPADHSGMPRIHQHWLSEKPPGDWTQYNLQQASDTLDQLGFKRNANGFRDLPRGGSWSLDISVVSGWSDWVRAANVIASNLRDLGIRTTVKALDYGAWFQSLQNGDFSGSISWSIESATPYEYFRWLMAEETVYPIGQPAPGNWHRFGDPRVDELLQRFEKTNESGEQRRIVKELADLFAMVVPALPLFSSPAWGVFNTTRFKGFPSQDNPYVVLSPNADPDFLLVLQRLQARGTKL